MKYFGIGFVYCLNHITYRGHLFAVKNRIL